MFTYAVILTGKYFIFFYAIINRIAILILFLDYPLLVYRKAIDSCLLTLYPETFLNLSISSNSVLMDPLGFSMHKILSSNLDTLISFSCLIALARTSSTILNRNGGIGHPCLIPGLREKTFSLLAFSIMLFVGFL